MDKTARRVSKWRCSVIVINVVTNPLSNFLYLHNFFSLLSVEVGVFVFEALLVFVMFKMFSFKIRFYEAFAVSFIANIVSYCIGTPFLRVIVGMM